LSLNLKEAKNMKKLIISATFAMMAAACWGQGTVNFLNSPGNLSSPPDRLIRWDSVTIGTTASINPFGSNNAPVVNTSTHTYQAQLYFGSSTAAEGSLVAVSIAPNGFRASTSASPGQWLAGVSAGSRVLDGFASGTVNLQVRVWDLASGTDYFSAVAANGIAGKSAIFTYLIPSGAQPAPSEFNMSNFTGFVLTLNQVPEPTTLALAGLGATALLIFRRRK